MRWVFTSEHVDYHSCLALIANGISEQNTGTFDINTSFSDIGLTKVWKYSKGIFQGTLADSAGPAKLMRHVTAMRYPGYTSL